ncbi:ATP synthase F0 subunit B [Patescibacteria group bacterium]|nr:ATP synthase F0 subunit B [Patescibacteria group bacterium]
MDALAKLGIDWWGILLYVVNFGVLLAVLTRFLYRPLMKAIDDRRLFIASNVEASEKLRTDFEKEAAQQKADTAAHVARLEAELAHAKIAADAQAKQLLAEAEERKAKLLAETQQQIEAMKTAVKKDLEADMLRTMKNVVTTVLRDRVPAEVVQESVRDAWKEAAKA